MVDVDKIKRDLYKNFEVDGSVKIDPSTGVVDVDGGVYLRGRTKKLPVTFGTVDGDFRCSDSVLVSLAGAPRNVNGGFFCSNNRLTQLYNAPESVTGSFYCDNNKLISLEGAPHSVGGDFYCQSNMLTDLKGAPNSVGGGFYCHGNNLISLEGAPSHVEDYFYCKYSPQLPLLSLLNYKYVGVISARDTQDVNKIINQYAGQGKPGAIRAAVALIRAGYKDNARW